MLRKLSILVLVCLGFVLIAVPLYSQKKQSVRTTKEVKKDKIVVTGPKVKIEKEFTLFESTQDKRPVATKGSNYIEANVIRFHSAKNYTISEGNVIFRNYERNLEITSGYCEFYGDSGDVVFTKEPRMYLSNENLFAGGEKVFMNVNEDRVNVEENAFITNEVTRAFSRRLEYISKNNLAKMVGDVKIFSTNMNIRSDIAYLSIYSNNISNYIGYGNVFVETKNISAKSEYLFATFRKNNEIDRYVLMTNVLVDGKDLFVEAFKMVGVITNLVEDGKTNDFKLYTFSGAGKQVYYHNKKEDTILECDLLEVLMNEENEMVSSSARGRVRAIK